MKRAGTSNPAAGRCFLRLLLQWSHKHTWRKRLRVQKTVQRSSAVKKAVAKPPVRSVPKKFVYFFGNGKAEGNRTMKDTLGGKGSGLAEMTNAGLPVPAGVHHLHRCVQPLLRATAAKLPPEHRPPEMRLTAAQAREERRRTARLEQEAAAGIGALGREVLDAGHDGHDPQPRPQRCRRSRA